MKSIKEQLSEEFRDKLLKTCYAFEDAKDNSPEKIENWEKERDNISAFLSQAIDRVREETIREVEEMVDEINPSYDGESLNTNNNRRYYEQGFEEGYAVAKRNYEHCIRCGVDKKIIKRDKYVCEHLGKAYNKHIYK